jgi:hypothetical protein
VIFEVAITLSMLFDVCVGWMGRRREEEREMKGQREGKRAVLIPRSSPPVPSFPQLDTPLAPHQQCSYSVAMSFAARSQTTRSCPCPPPTLPKTSCARPS